MCKSLILTKLRYINYKYSNMICCRTNIGYKNFHKKLMNRLFIISLFISVHISVSGENILVESSDNLFEINGKSLRYDTPPQTKFGRHNIHIREVKFANVSESQKIIDYYGSMLYTDMLYLKPRIYFSYENTDTHDIELDLSYNIIKPDGTISKSSEYKEYTFTQRINLKPHKYANEVLELHGWGNLSGTIYKEPGEYQFEIWLSKRLLYSTSFMVRKITIPNLEIKEVRFASSRKKSGTDNDYNALLYTNMPFLKPKIYFDYENPDSRKTNFTLSYNIISPDGVIIKENKSDEYTHNEKITVNDSSGKNQELELKGWGSISGKMYKNSGVYRFEIWLSGQRLYFTNFQVRNPDDPIIEIKDVKFANVSRNERIIDPYDATLYTNTLYLKPKIYLNYINSSKKDIKMPMSYNVIQPNGEIITTWGEYSFSDEIILSAGGRENTVLDLNGLGREDGTLYTTPGEYTFEIWVSSEKIYSKSFRVIAK